MRILADENVPAQLVGMLRALLPGHEVRAVQEIKWAGRDDAAVLADAAARGFDAFLTRDSGQFTDPAHTGGGIVTAHGLHHIRYRQRSRGRSGLAPAMGAVITAMTDIVTDLTRTTTPHTVHITPPPRTPLPAYELHPHRPPP